MSGGIVALAPGSWPAPLLRAVRVSNKHLLNPVMLRLAGRKGWYAAAIRHTGRKSGKQYTTPVVADPVTDGFLIPLPYGKQVDWLQNVLAAGGATLSAEGDSCKVVHPEVIEAKEALPLLSEGRRRMFQRVGVDNYLKLTREPDKG
jgi:deazaflavin-dependent oxidoreductase (nitroreductase family)